MAQLDKSRTVSVEELLIASLATSDALTKLLIEKGLINQMEFLEQLKAERATYQALLRKPS